MIRIGRALLLAGALWACAVTELQADTAKTYQVTGQVLEVSDQKIVVQKGDERWELTRDDKTKVDGELKVGSKVTIHYRMSAVSVETKADKNGSKKNGK